ncbi:flagellar hook-length control protein FliK [Sphingomonas sp. LM7]|uniref:flagellar hook-length control protein FliK n=1 Tax=Sphingomonas sp. LM7 TaxID=1938607 RepID=UPI000983B335|nr:flagellar hook-length control protein FliK [Sphingomonas sp. LM7]AQR73617.1 hypothetical protein BXU08_08195 [Sphingomonas sp. LM7]
MQINPFGFPLGAGTQPAPGFGAAELGFAEALGVAIEGGAQPVRLVASPTPPQTLNPKLQALLAQTQLAAQPAPEIATLPGFQQTTSLSQLMATAAKLPTADAMPVAEPILPAGQPATTPVVGTTALAVAAQPDGKAVPTTIPAEPRATSSQPATPAPQPATVAAQAVPEPEPEPQPETTQSVEGVPAKPQKGPRAGAAACDADPIPTADAKTAVPIDMLATVVVPQQVIQPQVTPRDVATPQTGNAATGIKKVTLAAAPTDAGAQAISTGNVDFARAIAARGESTGSEANADGQAQPDAGITIAAKADSVAPQFPQPTHAVAAADPARTATAAAPAPTAEPMIEARANHLGHSLGVEIARKVELGEETLRIRLNPIELGRIEVTLAFDDKGSLQATVRTESAQAMDLLRQDMPDLARTLDQAGVRTDAQSFRFENRSGDGGGQQGQQPSQNRGQFASSDDDAAIAEPIYRPIRSDGQVDLLA